MPAAPRGLQAAREGNAYLILLVAATSTVTATLYMAKISHDVEGLCSRPVVALAADWAFLSMQCSSTLAVLSLWWDRSAETARVMSIVAAINLYGFVASLGKALVFAFLRPGLCVFFELLWCWEFGVVAFLSRIEALVEGSKAPGRAMDLAQAEAQVARVMEQLGGQAKDACPGAQQVPRALAPQCAICLADCEAEEGTRTTPCAHLYHDACLRAWLLRQTLSLGVQSCAVCRRDLGADGEAEQVFAI